MQEQWFQRVDVESEGLIRRGGGGGRGLGFGGRAVYGRPWDITRG